MRIARCFVSLVIGVSPASKGEPVMEWIEANPLPQRCQECHEEDCYNCDYAGERWYLSKADELRSRKQMMLRAIERYQRKIAEIDKELEVIENG